MVSLRRIVFVCFPSFLVAEGAEGVGSYELVDDAPIGDRTEPPPEEGGKTGDLVEDVPTFVDHDHIDTEDQIKSLIPQPWGDEDESPSYADLIFPAPLAKVKDLLQEVKRFLTSPNESVCTSCGAEEVVAVKEAVRKLRNFLENKMKNVGMGTVLKLTRGEWTLEVEKIQVDAKLDEAAATKLKQRAGLIWV